MWSYYGSKTNLAKHYPKPKHELIIECFAGTARYSLLYWEKEVLLVDKHEVIIEIWKFLQQCSKEDILKLPRLKAGEMVDSIKYDCQAQRNLVGFLAGYGLTHPANKASTGNIQRPHRMDRTIKQIAENLYKIKHWRIMQGCYLEIPNQKATHFIDPPYEIGGYKYVYGSKGIDYNILAEYCKTREGQVIVCENTKAKWLDFNPLKKIQGANGQSEEAIWSNEKTNFDNKQLKLIY